MLALVYGVAFDLCYRGVLPFGALASVTGVVLGALLVLLGATIVWVLLVLPLRLISDAPPMLPPPGTNFTEAYAKARADLERRDTPVEKRRYHLRMAAAGTAVGIACAIAVAANVEMAPEAVLTTPIAFAIACALLVPYHALRALLTR